jgi:predicted lipid-binding transport protein (Tim44 family)
MKGLLLGFAILLLGALTQLPEASAQSQIAQPRSATAAPSAAPRAAPAPRAPTARSTRGWMPVLGTLAAGGLLGALFGGNVLFGILMAGLLVAIVVFIARMIMRARAEGVPAAQLAGLGSETVVAPPPSQAAGLNGVTPTAGSGSKLPAGFDLAGFVRTAKLNFVRLQIANELGNLGDIREFSTPQMFAQLGKEIRERTGKRQHADVVSLNAELTELLTEGDMHRARVRFSGMAREMPGAAPTGFAEIWHLAKPADGSTGWLLAGIQQDD